MFESHPVTSGFYRLIFLMTLLCNLENYYEGTWDFKIKGGNLFSCYIPESRHSIIVFFLHTNVHFDEYILYKRKEIPVLPECS